jgi:MFS family permease
MRLLPKISHHNSRLYLTINIFQNLWFIEAVWYFFFANFVSYTQIALAFAASTLIGILAEIPTGVFADRWGRKLSVTIGSGILTLGWFLMATTSGFWQFFLGGVLSAVGRAFVSGALDAIVYDSLPSNSRQQRYEKLVTISDQLTTFLFAVTVLIGGFLYHYYIRLPHLLFAFSNLIAFLVSLRLVEGSRDRDIFMNPDNILTQNLAGFRQLLSKNLRIYLLPSLIILSFFFLYDWGFSKPAMALNFGFHVEGQAMIYALFSLVNILGIRSLPRLRRVLGDRIGLTFLSLMIGLGFFLGSLPLGFLGIFTLLIIELSSYIAKPWISIVLNRYVSSRYRATTLSTLEFISKLPFIFTNIILGRFLDAGRSDIFHRFAGIAIILTIGVYIAINYKRYVLAKTS